MPEEKGKEVRCRNNLSSITFLCQIGVNLGRKMLALNFDNGFYAFVVGGVANSVRPLWPTPH